MSPSAQLFPGLSFAGSKRSYLGLCYILLLFLPFALPHGPLLAADLLAPLMALLLCWQWRAGLRVCREQGYALPIFLILAGIATLLHLVRGSGSLYDFSVFAYMALLYVYFRLHPPGASLQKYLGLGMLPSLLLGFFYACLSLWLAWLPELGLFYRDPYSAERGLSLLALRYQFFFNNPNLLGSFYVLPIALVCPWLTELAKKCRGAKNRLVLAAAVVLLLLPLYSSASKHMLLSFALLCAVPLQAWPELRRPLQRLLLPGLALFALLCLLTVLLPVFPLSGQFPYINVKHQSNYSIHQEIYLKMLSMKRTNWVWGLGNRGCREAYPQLADRDKIEYVMQQYNSPHWVQPFCSFMDPHQEYLNLASLFGLPALLAMLCFWLRLSRQKNEYLRFFCLALLLCCFWDDLLSKRWLWVTAALLYSRENKHEETGMDTKAENKDMPVNLP